MEETNTTLYDLECNHSNDCPIEGEPVIDNTSANTPEIDDECNEKMTNIWCFGGYAGLDFNNEPPSILIGSSMASYESCASIADSNGNLLFYSDGISVWDSNHDQMPNGFGLMGHSSTTQGSLIIKQPNSENIFYIFTLDDLTTGLVNGLRYTMIDMNLNGGLGDVIAGTKNTFLHHPCTEKLTAVRHCNNIDIWVVAHEWESNAFLAYLLTSSGLTTTPVVSNVGTIHIGGGGFMYDNWNAEGYLTASPDGNRLALAITKMDRFEVFDFDNTTGMVTNPIVLQSPDYYYSYGVAFSPDATKLYATSLWNRTLYQFDLSAGTATDIVNSATLIATANAQYIGALQLAPDGKIYLSKYNENFLAAIGNPNALGTACNYAENAVSLGTAYAQFGLPNFAPYHFDPSPNITGNLAPCTLETQQYGVSALSCEAIYEWQLLGDGTLTVLPPAEAIVTYNSAGAYMLIVTQTTDCQVLSDTLQIVATACSSPLPTADFTAAVTSLCIGGCTDFVDLSQNATAWQWTFEGAIPATSTDQDPANICYPQAGVYAVQLIASNGAGSDTLALTAFVETSATFMVEQSTQICTGDSLWLQGQYQHQTGTTTIR
ncbi:MAG: PKD domain-containing protein [Sphingobacteriales bacterium]|nr:PKD domain-containing protein [Sphingobacteriales bacterium]